MTALEYLKQPMKYQTFLGGGIASVVDTVKLLGKIEKSKQAQIRADKIKARELADTLSHDKDTQDETE